MSLFGVVYCLLLSVGLIAWQKSFVDQLTRRLITRESG